MNVAGFDVDTFTIHLVILEADDSALYWPLTLPKHKSAWGRCRHIPTVAQKNRITHATFENTAVAVIEDPIGSRGQAGKLLGLACGATSTILPNHVDIVPMSPHEWYLALTGEKRPQAKDAAKQGCKTFVLEECQWGDSELPLDAFEAYGMARGYRNKATGGGKLVWEARDG